MEQEIHLPNERYPMQQRDVFPRHRCRKSKRRYFQRRLPWWLPNTSVLCLIRKRSHQTSWNNKHATPLPSLLARFEHPTSTWLSSLVSLELLKNITSNLEMFDILRIVQDHSTINHHQLPNFEQHYLILWEWSSNGRTKGQMHRQLHLHLMDIDTPPTSCKYFPGFS